MLRFFCVWNTFIFFYLTYFTFICLLVVAFICVIEHVHMWSVWAVLFSVVFLRETGNVTLWLGLRDDLTDSGPDGVQVIHPLLLATFLLPMKWFRSEKYSLTSFPSVATVILYANNYSFDCSNVLFLYYHTCSSLIWKGHLMACRSAMSFD